MVLQHKSYRKFIASAATATMVTAVVAPAISAAGFTDVTERYSDSVDFLLSKGAKGFSDSYFGVNEEIKRIDAAILTAKVLGLDIENAPASGFTDVPTRGVKAVNALKAAGITSGKTKTTFDSNSPITRGEVAIWLQKGFDLHGGADLSFNDVTKNYEAAVKALVANNVANGMSSEQFGVNLNVKRGDFAIFLHRSSKVVTAPPVVTPPPVTPPGNGDPNTNYKLSLMHTNDTHANLDNIAKTVTAVKQVRAVKPDALLLSAGDVFSGTLYFNEFNGLADLEFMNLMKYDAMTFGNHEFDSGTSVLNNFVEAAEFPFVSANVDFSADANLSDDFKDEVSTTAGANGEIYNGIVKEVNGEKIGIFGLTTAETVEISSPGEDVVFEDYIEAAKEAVAAFEAAGVNKIVALSHLGFMDGGGDNDVTLAKSVEGIDVIVGGHSHDKITAPVIDTTGEEATVIVQANEYNKFLGTLDVEFDKDGKVVGHLGSLIDVKTVEADAEAAAMLKPYADKVAEIKDLPVGEAAVKLVGGNPAARTAETNLGNAITDGMLAKAKQINPNTVIALQNGGGIRTSVEPGPLTLGEVLTVMPFGNALGIMKLTGSEIVAALEHSVKDAPAAHGGFLQVSGMKFTYDSRKDAGERVVSVSVQDKDGNYSSLVADQEYFVATNIFTAKGGDGYDMFKVAYDEGRVSEPGFVDWEVFSEYVKSQPNQTISPVVEGRIIDVATAPEVVDAANFNGTADAPNVFEGDVRVDVTGVATLENAVVKGDLYLKGNSTVTLTNVTVEGETILED
ncbi:5'-nucleotidase C-terminal domain-containing protein [Bacillus sp. ISL-45]|uniref:5'-nucleotidase C-terminal domain-containing protein n=1 Tax=Bacillus sp. ISL-45 TaxID=2819128 RepID=UPI001BE8FA4A|nr:5'-nucleotidase C-terminal domain-containing protein [Bacillus sp. ISL-45]MBT2661579.1 5'-nucleotidase C-terminal domain-containing protein [Bacillus sp. ISL-45]